VLLIGVLVFTWVNRNAPEIWSIVEPPLVAAAVAYTLIGTLLATRRPGNRLGWLFLVIGVLVIASTFALQWAVFGLETRPGAPAAAAALWLGLCLSAAGLGLSITFPLLLFPDGHLVGRRVWIVAGLATIGLIVLLLGLANGSSAPPGFPSLYERTPNPFAVSDPNVDPGIGIQLLSLSALLSSGLLLARFRASRGVTRQQYKWVVFAMALLVATFIADTAARVMGSRVYVIIGPMLSASIAFVPVSMGIAILRHQLFDIDRVINRALLYAFLSTGLIGVYGLAVVIFQALLDPITQGGDLAVAATTLLVAALFRPLRAGIQRVMDRRFNRAHYDATQTIEAFNTKLRDEVDLETVGHNLLAVVNATMQPTHASLWMRPKRTP
jgi:hypothetical protein